MKTKNFKIVLPAFAFMLAIVASFAFTSTENGLESRSAVQGVPGYIQGPGGETDCIEDRKDCVAAVGTACTSVTLGNPLVFKKTNTSCNQQLYFK
ncbi:MAG: hypothetical protein COB01_11485 [Lutibacter sp.]|nr:MAG: hypothetical protein COB01_11485 [Lutibacter sp.]